MYTTTYSRVDKDSVLISVIGEEYYNSLREHKDAVIVNKDTEKEFILVPENLVGFFHIASLSRDDFEEHGYDASSLADETMQNIASEMCENICEEMWAEQIEYYAEEYELPRATKKVFISDIVWDVDDDDIAIELPTSTWLDVPKQWDEDDAYDGIADLLSDEYDYCVETFSWDEKFEE